MRIETIAVGWQAPAGPKVPVTPEGEMLAREVSASAVLAADSKARLIAEIVNHESTHGRCTKTFIKKLRKQTRPASLSSRPSPRGAVPS
jgi:hypothetical protein